MVIRPGSRIVSSDDSYKKKTRMEAIELSEHDTPYGLWSFALPLQKCQVHLAIAGPAGKLRRNSASRQESSDKAANTNTRYVEAFGGISLRVNKHVCSGCRRNFFDPNDLYAKLKPRGSENALLCDYISNSCSTMTVLKLITILLFQRLGEMMKKEPRACPGPRSSISIGGASFMGETFKME